MASSRIEERSAGSRYSARAVPPSTGRAQLPGFATRFFGCGSSALRRTHHAKPQQLPGTRALRFSADALYSIHSERYASASASRRMLAIHTTPTSGIAILKGELPLSKPIPPPFPFRSARASASAHSRSTLFYTLVLITPDKQSAKYSIADKQLIVGGMWRRRWPSSGPSQPAPPFRRSTRRVKPP